MLLMLVGLRGSKFVVKKSIRGLLNELNDDDIVTIDSRIFKVMTYNYSLKCFNT